MIKNVPIPKFDKTNTTHTSLSQLSQTAHKEFGKSNKKIENKIDRLSLKVITSN